MKTRLVLVAIAFLVLPLGNLGPLNAVQVLQVYVVGIGWAFAMIVLLKPLVRSVFTAWMVGAIAALGLSGLTAYFAFAGDSLEIQVVGSLIASALVGGIPGIVVWLASDQGYTPRFKL